MTPRLPVNMPRAATAWISPKGSTRFCSGTAFPPFHRLARMISERQSLDKMRFLSGRIDRMRVFVVQNFDNTGLGQVGAALRRPARKSIFATRIRATLPDERRGHDAAVVLGGGQNALDDEAFPYIPAAARPDARLRATATARCSAFASAASCSPAPSAARTRSVRAPRIRLAARALTGDGAADPVLGVAARLPDLSVARRHLLFARRRRASGQRAAAANQAFRIGRATYGIQFHFEADRPLLP